MANRKITQFTALASGAQTPTMVLPIVDPSLGATDAANKKVTLNNLFADLGLNTTDKGIGQTGVSTGSAPAASAANQMKWYFNTTDSTFKLSRNTGLYGTVQVNNSASVTPGAGTTQTIDLSIRTMWTVLLPAGNITVSTAGTQLFPTYFTIQVYQDAVGGRTITWDGTFFNNSAAMTIQPDATANSATTFNWYSDGTNCFLISWSSDAGNFAIPTSTFAALPANPGYVAEYLLTDTNKSIWAYNTNASQWVSQNGQVYNVKDFGAKGDGITNDTAAVQAAINAACAGGTTNVVYVPEGTYNINSTLQYYGDPGLGIAIRGAKGMTRGGTGAQFKWIGANGGILFAFIGANASEIENLQFIGNSLAKYPLAITAANHVNATLSGPVTANAAPQTVTLSNVTNIAIGTLLPIDGGNGVASAELVEVSNVAGSTITAIFSKNHLAGAAVGWVNGSSGVKLNNVSTHSPTGAGCAGVLLGNKTSSFTPQVSEVELHNCTAYGNAGTSTGFLALGSGNVKNFHFVDGGAIDNFNAYDLTECSSAISATGCTLAGNTNYDFKISTANVLLSSIEVEESSLVSFVYGTTGANAGSLTVMQCYVSAGLTAMAAISYTGSITLIGNNFFNSNGVNPARIYGMGILTDAAPASIVSIGNFYQNASGASDVFFDLSGDALADFLTPGSYANTHEPLVTSINDFGGVQGALIKFRPTITTGSNLRIAQAIVDNRLTMPATVSTSTGIIYKDTSSFLHNFKSPTGASANPAGHNVFLGVQAGNFTMGSTATSTDQGSYNIGIGDQTLPAVTTGGSNVAIGYAALGVGTTITSCIAIGNNTLYQTTGNNNIGIGGATGYDLTTGQSNVFIGVNTGRGITTGGKNTILGANVTGLAAGTANNIILADGDGNIRLRFDNTGLATFAAGIVITGKQKNLTVSTGAGAALLGANSPAATLTAPFEWINVTLSDGSTGYVPAWK